MIRSSLVLSGTAASLFLVAGAAPGHAAERRPREDAVKATWYGGAFHGRLTASGARFNQNALTAAHPHLPLGSRVRVTRQDTGASVVVTINDRQPAARGRSIDLARGAAERIGLVQRGTGWVTLRPAAGDQPVEVAEAPEEAAPALNPLPPNPPRRGPPRKPPARP